MSGRIPPEDLLDQAIEAMRSESAPPGPSQQAVDDTVSALRQRSQPKSFWQRTFAMTLTQKIAASIGMAIGGLTLYFVFTLFSAFSSVSYGQVATVIKSMRSMTCDTTITVPGTNQPYTSKMFAMEPDKMRQEQPNGMI